MLQIKINPEDSASNVLIVKANSLQSHSQLSAHIKAQGDKAALMDCVAALKRKPLIEAQEES